MNKDMKIKLAGIYLVAMAFMYLVGWITNDHSVALNSTLMISAVMDVLILFLVVYWLRERVPIKLKKLSNYLIFMIMVLVVDITLYAFFGDYGPDVEWFGQLVRFIILTPTILLMFTLGRKTYGLTDKKSQEHKRILSTKLAIASVILFPIGVAIITANYILVDPVNEYTPLGILGGAFVIYGLAAFVSALVVRIQYALKK